MDSKQELEILLPKDNINIMEMINARDKKIIEVRATKYCPSCQTYHAFCEYCGKGRCQTKRFDRHHLIFGSVPKHMLGGFMPFEIWKNRWNVDYIVLVCGNIVDSCHTKLRRQSVNLIEEYYDAWKEITDKIIQWSRSDEIDTNTALRCIDEMKLALSTDLLKQIKLLTSRNDN